MHEKNLKNFYEVYEKAFLSGVRIFFSVCGSAEHEKALSMLKAKHGEIRVFIAGGSAPELFPLSEKTKFKN